MTVVGAAPIRLGDGGNKLGNSAGLGKDARILAQRAGFESGGHTENTQVLHSTSQQPIVVQLATVFAVFPAKIQQSTISARLCCLHYR